MPQCGTYVVPGSAYYARGERPASAGVECFTPVREPVVDGSEFSQLRRALQKTQAQMARLLGTSLKAVHSYEQGWRSIPAHVERQMFFLCAAVSGRGRERRPCWVIMKCPDERKRRCPAWEFASGRLCWFVNGTLCKGEVCKDWQAKMEICRSCEVFLNILGKRGP